MVEAEAGDRGGTIPGGPFNATETGKHEIAEIWAPSPTRLSGHESGRSS
jgi:hypothetical protein